MVYSDKLIFEQGLQFDDKGSVSSENSPGANKYGFYPKLDLDKLSLILSIENSNMLRINPELLEASNNQGGEQTNSESGSLDLLAAQVKRVFVGNRN